MVEADMANVFGFLQRGPFLQQAPADTVFAGGVDGQVVDAQGRDGVETTGRCLPQLPGLR